MHKQKIKKTISCAIDLTLKISDRAAIRLSGLRYSKCIFFLFSIESLNPIFLKIKLSTIAL